jgi:hypothetical protein
MTFGEVKTYLACGSVNSSRCSLSLVKGVNGEAIRKVRKPTFNLLLSFYFWMVKKGENGKNSSICSSDNVSSQCGG